MPEALHIVDLDSCRGDSICVDVCPENVLEILDGNARTVDSREDNCILCGQCVAVCPTEAMHMPTLPDDFGELDVIPFGYDEFHHFLLQRRSVRFFKDLPV